MHKGLLHGLMGLTFGKASDLILSLNLCFAIEALNRAMKHSCEQPKYTGKEGGSTRRQGFRPPGTADSLGVEQLTRQPSAVPTFAWTKVWVQPGVGDDGSTSYRGGSIGPNTDCLA